MKCEKCGKEYIGESCPDCATEEDILTKDTQMSDTSTDASVPEKAGGKKNIPTILKKWWLWAAAAAIIIPIILGVTFKKSDDVKAVIAAIDSVYESADEYSDLSIRMIQDSYDKLSKKEKHQVRNYKKLDEAREKCNEMKAAHVKAEIADLSEKSDEYELRSVRIDYDALTDEQKKYVDNIDVLENLENHYYDPVITAAEKAIDKITYSGGPITEDQQKSIEEAEKAIEDVPENVREKVKNIDKYNSALKIRENYYITNAQTLIDEAIKNNDAFSKGEEAYNLLTEEQKEQIKNYDVFTEKYDAFKSKSPIQLLSYRVSENSISTPELYLNAKNISSKPIKEFSAAVFAWDSDNLPVAVDFNDYYKRISYNNPIKVGESTGFDSYWTLYGTYDKSKIQKVICVVDEVEFFDDTKWENPQYDTLREKYEQQILNPTDSNILKRG